jgi:cell division initiation protein
MSLTPVEIRHVKPSKSLIRGYDKTEIDELLNEIAVSFEDVWRERADLADKVEDLESDLGRFKELEALLRTTLISAERAAVGLREQAAKEAELIIEAARNEAREITRTARSDHERLLTEARRLRSLLQSALALVDDAPPEQVAKVEAA